MTKLLDLTGRMYGSLTVIKRHPVNTSAGKSRWVVKCNCGKYCVVVGGSLTQGLTVSCGSGHDRLFNDLTGSRFGELYVIRLQKRLKGGTRRSVWVVECSCGFQESYTGETLLRGVRKLCSKCTPSPNLIELTNKKYGKWSVVSYSGKSKCGMTQWNCVCECGRTGIVNGGNLRSGTSLQCRYCGDRTHNQSKTSEYRAWAGRKRIEQKKLLDSSWTLEMDNSLRDFFSCCVLCGTEKPLNVDHMLPLNLGYGLFTDNVLILCDSCNSRKHKKYIADLPPEIRRKLIDASCEFQDYLEWQMYAEPVNV